MNIFKRKSASAIGIIGGSNGPTALFIRGKKKSAKNTEQEDFLNFAATKITANAHPFSEIEQHLIAKYNAVPYALSQRQQQMLKVNIIINHFRELLDLPAPLPPNPTKKQLLKYAQNDTTFEQAENYPLEKLGLIMKAYEIPAGEAENPIVELELTTEYMAIHNSSDKYADELCLWQGVSKDDIANKTPRFMAYAYTMKNLGILDFSK